MRRAVCAVFEDWPGGAAMMTATLLFCVLALCTRGEDDACSMSLNKATLAVPLSWNQTLSRLRVETALHLPLTPRRLVLVGPAPKNWSALVASTYATKRTRQPPTHYVSVLSDEETLPFSAAQAMRTADDCFVIYVTNAFEERCMKLCGGKGAAVVTLYDGLVIGADDAAGYETWRNVVVGCPCAEAEADL